MVAVVDKAVKEARAVHRWNNQVAHKRVLNVEVLNAEVLNAEVLSVVGRWPCAKVQ